MGRKNLFGKGYEAAYDEEKRRDAERKRNEKVIWRLFLKPDEERTVRFLTEEPINFYEHTIPSGSKYENYVCPQEDCELCDSGNKASFRGAFLVYDKTPYKSKDGKTRNGTVYLYVTGTQNVTKLDRQHSKYGLTNRDYTIVRVGKGKSTTYEFERGEKTGKLSTKKIESILPEVYAEMYNGTEESLYDIIRASLQAEMELQTPKSVKEEREDDYDDEFDGEEYEDDELEYQENLKEQEDEEEYDDYEENIQYDEEKNQDKYEEDDEDDYDDEDEEDYKPPKSKIRKPLQSKTPKSSGTSAKSMLKSRKRGARR